MTNPNQPKSERPEAAGVSSSRLITDFYARKSPEDQGSRFVQTLELKPESIDTENRTIEFVAATDRWIDRGWWTEKLVIDEESVDVARLDKGISFCRNHNHDDVHGRALYYSIDSEKGQLIITVRFSKKKSSRELFDDIADGIRPYVSIGYIVINQTRTAFDGEEDDRPTEYLVTKWQPIELSSVGVPADEESTSRSQHQNSSQRTADNNLAEENTMRNKKSPKQGDAGEQNETVTRSEDPQVRERETPDPQGRNEDQEVSGRSNDVSVSVTERGNERVREINAITAMGVEHDMIEEARQAVANNVSQERFAVQVLDQICERSRDNAPATDIGLTERELRDYSVFDAIEAWEAGGQDGMRKHAPLEWEASEAVADQLGRNPRGFFIPAEVQNDFGRRMNVGKREMQAGSATQGANLVGTTLRGDQFIDFLQDRSVLLSLGAKVITGLVGEVDIPRGDGGVTFDWVGESAAPTPSNAEIGQVQLRYKTLAGAVQLSRKLMKQSTPSAEAYVIDLLLTGMALGIDNAAFEGAGGNSILGIFNTPGINAVPLAGSFATWSEIIDMQTAIDSDNALVDNMAFVCESSVAGNWQKNLKFAGVSGPIMENNMVNGSPVYRKTSLAQYATLFGNFADWVFGMWGVLDLRPDRATDAAADGLWLRTFQDVDGAVRRTGSFCKTTPI